MSLRTAPNLVTALTALLVALAIACLSTVLSFGALALSHNPLLRAMGMTAAIGVLLSLVLAPLAYRWVAPIEPRADNGSVRRKMCRARRPNATPLPESPEGQQPEGDVSPNYASASFSSSSSFR